MGITVAVKVEHLALPKILVSAPSSEQSGVVLVPNVETYGTVKATVKDFIRRNLFIPEDLQVLQAPLFRKLSDKDSVEDVYKRYACQADIENPELHLDEDNFVFFAREGGRSIDLEDSMRLEEYHILEKTMLHLRRLPQPLPKEGGRIFVETKNGILPLLGVNHETQVLEVKHALERMTGIPVDQQLLSSVGRIMHDGFSIKDFDGPHRVCEDSTLDLCKSGDSNIEQAHLRMVISVSVMGEQSFTMVVQGRDLVQSVLQVVEARTGVATWQQRITYSGKILQDKKTLSEYHIHPECTLQVTIFRSPCSKPPPKMVNNVVHSRENSGAEEQKPAARKIRLLRTSKGHIIGTITIPVLTTDTISDLRRKIRRTLQPLTERNFVVFRSPVGDSDENGGTPTKATPSPSKNDPLSSSGRRLSRVLSFTGRTFSSPLTTSNNNAGVAIPQSGRAALTLEPAESSNAKKVTRVLSFRNFSGPLVSPSKHRRPDAPTAPLFPPPLSSPNASPAKQRIDVSEIKVNPVKKVLLNDVRPSEGSPLKFVPMRPIVAVTPPPKSSSGGARRQFHSLPEQPPPVEPLLLHTTGPISTGHTNNTSSPKSNGRSTKEATPGAATGVEKRGLGAWLTDSMHSLKVHIKSPFAER